MDINASFNIVPDHHRVSLGQVTLYFSFDTIIGFDDDRDNGKPGRVVRENVWGPKTGRHLNSIDFGTPEAKAKRVPGDEFEALLDDLLEGLSK